VRAKDKLVGAAILIAVAMIAVALLVFAVLVVSAAVSHADPRILPGFHLAALTADASGTHATSSRSVTHHVTKTRTPATVVRDSLYGARQTKRAAFRPAFTGQDRLALM
jgi:hypothetical protein